MDIPVLFTWSLLSLHFNPPELDPLSPGETSVEDYLSEPRSWVFSPPHSSHMGGTWECMIGQNVERRVWLQPG
ncbi:hypothetical protein COCON_G00076480 [Conger conger]|uniref:Uncharacterized protein n=1 Tax=Conger conger TaxID=82655 RepID=A0A9Q1DPK2_CONCO|nr:hypothetical protein COCON_G00076480 [Conger conger]